MSLGVIVMASCSAGVNETESTFTREPIVNATVPVAEASPTIEPTAEAARKFLRDLMVTNEEWPFVALYAPEFIQASDAEHVQPRDFVLGISINGESKAYPISMMWFHHVANDVVGGTPVAVTY